MHMDEKTASSGQKIADLFAENFSRAFTSHTDAGSLYPADTRPHNNHHHNCIGVLNFTERQVLKKIKQLDVLKGPGPDGIPPLLVKRCGSALALPLTIIINRSLVVGEFPDEWKKAKIIPLHKKGKLNEVKNYRPISILSCFSKLFEALVCPIISSHSNHLISEHQHGFKKGRSVETNLVAFVSELSREIDKGHQIDAVYTDFSSAFDKVSHPLLLKKLELIGIHGSFLNWFRSYLNRRQQVVSVNGFESGMYLAESGVPQGSHLGPILFSIFINDITTYIKHCNYKLFADDLKIYKVIDTNTDTNFVQNDIDNLKQWCDINRMHLNVNKCYYIKYTRKKKPIEATYSLNGATLQEVSEVRDLGVMIDSKLSFKLHIDIVVKRAALLLGFIRRNTKGFRSPRTKIILYNSLVRSCLEFASVAWNPFYTMHSQRIESIQRSFTRTLAFSCTGISHRSPYEYRNNYFKMHALRDRRKIRDLSFLHKVIHGSSDCSSILENITLNIPYNYPRKRVTKILGGQSARTNLAFNSPVLRMCRTYNEANVSSSDLDIFHDSFNVFKTKLVKSLVKDLK